MPDDYDSLEREIFETEDQGLAMRREKALLDAELDLAAQYEEELNQQEDETTAATDADLADRLAEIERHLEAETRARMVVAARAINMGVLHAAGCSAPGRTTSSLGGQPWTITPETAVNDAIKQVADGKGGLMAKCFECGSTTPLDPPSRTKTGSPVATAEQALEAYARLHSDRKAAAELGISRTQLRRLRGVQN